MYFIGEIGSNIRSRKDAKELILRLNDAGADAVKFQWLSFSKLYGFNPFREDVSLKLRRVWESRLNSLCQLSLEDLEVFSTFCDEVGIDFLCSVFDPKDVKLLDPLVRHHKIASCEISDPTLLEAVASGSKKHVFISTGAATDADISHAISVIGSSRVTLMYCDASYPANRSDLTYIQYLQNRFGVPVGLSDHSLEVYNTAFSAHWFYGAVAFEKHVKLDSRIRSADSGHSITVDDFGKMVKRVRDGHVFNEYEVPRDILRLHKRRLVATTPIHKFDRLRLGDNCGYYRMSYDPGELGESSDIDAAGGHFYAHSGKPEDWEATRTTQSRRTINFERIKLERP
jgi:N,N'-diacetyllegionaminate synthase